MNYHPNGLAELSSGTTKTRIADFAGDDPCTVSNQDVFRHGVKKWADTTIGELINADCHTKSKGWQGRLSTSELAFFVKNHVRKVDDSTPCRVGTAVNRKAIRVDAIEYRTLSGILYHRPVSELVA